MIGGIDKYTKLMLHCNGDNGSTSFPDSSSSNHIMTAHTNAKVVTAQKKFGSGSAYFDSGYSDYLSTPADSDFDFGSGDFTVDLWIRFEEIPGGWGGLIGCNNSYSNWGIMYHPSFHGSNLHITFANPGYQRLEYGWSPSISQWYHIALIRNMADLKVFVDGTQLGSTYNIGTATIVFTPGDYLGVNQASGGPMNCWTDEVRISKGIARWTSNFVPPNEEYSNVPFFNPINTTLLLALPYGMQRGFSH
jgi:hypothetical protein